MELNKCLPANITNMDETGTAIGDVQRRKVLVYRGTKKRPEGVQAKQTRGEWVTSVECIRANGYILKPLVILKGKTLNDSWLVGKNHRDKVAGWSFAALQKGWSSQELGYQWLTEVYQPQTKTAEEEGQRRLLIVNGHGSHLSARFVQFCLSHNIDLLVLPPHTSHVLQPLDVGVFKDLKKALSWFAKHRWSCLNDGQGITSYWTWQMRGCCQ